MENEYKADFIRYYKDRSEDGNSYKDLWQLDREFEKKDAHFVSQHGMRIQDYELKRDHIGKTKTFDATDSRATLREQYKTRADAIARKHGFKGKSYEQHMKEQEAQKGQTQSGKPDNDKEPPPHSPAGSAKPQPKEPSKEEQRQAFLLQMRDTGGGLTKGKERER